MKLGHVFLLLSIIAGLAVSLPTPAMAACEDLRERIHENRGRLEELEGVKGMLHEERRETPSAEHEHEIEMRIREIERQQHELNQELGPLEEEFAQCRQPEELEGVKEMLHEERRETPGAEQKHEIEMHIGEIERQQNELNQKLRPLEEEFAQYREEPDVNDDNGPLPPGIIAAIIGAIGVVLAALIGLLRRR